MYRLETKGKFDAAHFLSGYDGKCANIHGHCWEVLVSVKYNELKEDKQERGMCVDFSKLKQALKEELEVFDHSFIIEKGSLKESTLNALKEEGFEICMVDFRPTAENFARYFYESLLKTGFSMDWVKVYETENNCALYDGSIE